MIRLALAFALTLTASPMLAQETPDGMTPGRLLDILLALDPETQPAGNGVALTIEGVPMLVVVDPLADRMRAMVSIRSVEGMSAEDLERVMQANFDTALDARYAVANGRLWGVYIHPLSPLRDEQLISGIGQTVNLALTYGSLFTGGALSYGGGDSAPLQRELIDRLLKKGQDI
ncbi:MAG: hypothetical protein HKP37_09060 [Boseongicola sp.]|nr:hypothetical protein [Boseongicola sp.]